MVLRADFWHPSCAQTYWGAYSDHLYFIVRYTGRDMGRGKVKKERGRDGMERCVLSSVWHTLTYHTVLCYFQCVPSCQPS